MSVQFSANQLSKDRCNMNRSIVLHISKLPVFEDLANQLRQALGLTAQQIKRIKYVDEEGDEVSLADDADLQIAYYVAERNGPLTIRVYTGFSDNSETSASVQLEVDTKAQSNNQEFAKSQSTDESCSANGNRAVLDELDHLNISSTSACLTCHSGKALTELISAPVLLHKPLRSVRYCEDSTLNSKLNDRTFVVFQWVEKRQAKLTGKMHQHLRRAQVLLKSLADGIVADCNSDAMSKSKILAGTSETIARCFAQERKQRLKLATFFGFVLGKLESSTVVDDSLSVRAEIVSLKQHYASKLSRHELKRDRLEPLSPKYTKIANRIETLRQLIGKCEKELTLLDLTPADSLLDVVGSDASLVKLPSNGIVNLNDESEVEEVVGVPSAMWGCALQCLDESGLKRKKTEYSKKLEKRAGKLLYLQYRLDALAKRAVHLLHKAFTLRQRSYISGFEDADRQHQLERASALAQFDLVKAQCSVTQGEFDKLSGKFDKARRKSMHLVSKITAIGTKLIRTSVKLDREAASVDSEIVQRVHAWRLEKLNVKCVSVMHKIKALSSEHPNVAATDGLEQLRSVAKLRKLELKAECKRRAVEGLLGSFATQVPECSANQLQNSRSLESEIATDTEAFKRCSSVVSLAESMSSDEFVELSVPIPDCFDTTEVESRLLRFSKTLDLTSLPMSSEAVQHDNQKAYETESSNDNDKEAVHLPDTQKASENSNETQLTCGNSASVEELPSSSHLRRGCACCTDASSATTVESSLDCPRPLPDTMRATSAAASSTLQTDWPKNCSQNPLWNSNNYLRTPCSAEQYGVAVEWKPPSSSWESPFPVPISVNRWPHQSPESVPRTAIERLNEMGFANRERNQMLLSRHDGRLDSVIGELLDDTDNDLFVHRY